jgi:hypothetical protein
VKALARDANAKTDVMARPRRDDALPILQITVSLLWHPQLDGDQLIAGFVGVLETLEPSN